MINTVYLLKNLVNKKVYIGQTWKTLSERFRNGTGYSKCYYINNAINKHGKQNFVYETLTFCGTQETADYWESYFIMKYNATNPLEGYNLRSGGARGLHSETSKRKISAAGKGRVTSENTKKKLS